MVYISASSTDSAASYTVGGDLTCQLLIPEQLLASSQHNTPMSLATLSLEWLRCHVAYGHRSPTTCDLPVSSCTASYPNLLL